MHPSQSFYDNNRNILASISLLPGFFLGIDQIRLNLYILALEAEEFQHIDIRKLTNSKLLKSFAVIYIIFGTALIGAAALQMTGITLESLCYIPATV